jgi:hypothetical protein
MVAWVVRELHSGTIVGTTRFHDIVREIDRVGIAAQAGLKRWDIGGFVDLRPPESPIGFPKWPR